MRSVFRRLSGLAAATGIAVIVTAAPSSAAEHGVVSPDPTAVEYALGVSPAATAIEYGVASPGATAIEYGL
ncbi:hypothetical protein ABH935_001594 [Catenulispora sp. GAS73]